MDNRGNQMMNRTLTLLTGAAVAIGTFAMASAADAQVMRYRGPQGYYGYAAPPYFRESPTYAPDRPGPRNYNNPGIPDHQDASRG
jgi:hypothetical protein